MAALGREFMRMKSWTSFTPLWGIQLSRTALAAVSIQYEPHGVSRGWYSKLSRTALAAVSGIHKTHNRG